MASTEEVKKELNKLNKSDLIHIIMEKKVPDDLKLSDKVVKFIESSENCAFSHSTDETYEKNADNETDPVSLLMLKCDLKVAKVELDAAKRLISELERTINNQELIVSLLQNPKMLDVNHGLNANNFASSQSAVATVPLEAETIRNGNPGGSHQSRNPKGKITSQHQQLEELSSAILEKNRIIINDIQIRMLINHFPVTFIIYLLLPKKKSHMDLQ